MGSVVDSRMVSSVTCKVCDVELATSKSAMRFERLVSRVPVLRD